MTHVTAYTAALMKLRDEPLSLTESDFQALAAFNEADERRARETVRTKQLEIVTKALPVQTKSPAELRGEAMADAVELAIKTALQPLVQKVRVQAAEIATLQQQVTHLHAMVQILERRDDPDEIDLAFDRAH